MAIGLYEVHVQLSSVTGKPEDNAVNVFHFEGMNAGTSHAVDAAALAARLTAFYNSVPSGAAATLASVISGAITRGAGACKFLTYFKDDYTFPDPFGSPVASTSWTLGAEAAGTSFPNEVALACSFHGDLTDVPETAANPTPPPTVIRPASRRRGRIYLGPLNENAGGEDGTSHDNIPNSGVRNSCIGAMVDLHAANDANLVWIVWSKTGEVPYVIVGGFVDYAWDTQRRRGTGPIARQLWP